MSTYTILLDKNILHAFGQLFNPEINTFMGTQDEFPFTMEDAKNLGGLEFGYDSVFWGELSKEEKKVFADLESIYHDINDRFPVS